MPRENDWSPDGIRTLDGGMNSGNSPSILPPNQAALMVNATNRGGFVSNRPGYIKRNLTFTDQQETSFRQGRFQGCGAYQYPGGAAILTSISGRIFRINVSTDFSAADISIPGDINPSNRDFVKFQQAETWDIIQDGQSIPLIFNGSSLRRSNLATPEVPVGDHMTYVMGRLWVSRGREYVAGDLYGTPSPTTNPAIGNADAVLKFTENTYIAEGGSFSVPMDGEGITGMIPIATPNTILGQGPILVATPNAIFANEVPVDRTLWKNLQYPVQTIQSVINGVSSQESMVQVNSDVWFRDSNGGIRSLIQALRDFHAPGNTPQSHELIRITDHEDRRLLPFCSGVLHDNRLLQTASPHQHQDRGVWFKGLYVLNFDGISGLTNKTAMSWDGVWNGLRFLRLVQVTINREKRVFAFTLNDDDEIDFWEISKNESFDTNETTGLQDKPIEWFVESRACNHGDSKQLKNIESGELWLENFQGEISIDLKYKPDKYPCWFDWDSTTRCAEYKFCVSGTCPSGDPLACITIKEFKPQYRPQIEFGRPEEECEPGAEKRSTNGYEFQYRVQITGPGRIGLFLAYASKQDKVIQINC